MGFATATQLLRAHTIDIPTTVGINNAPNDIQGILKCG